MNATMETQELVSGQTNSAEMQTTAISMQQDLPTVVPGQLSARSHGPNEGEQAEEQ